MKRPKVCIMPTALTPRSFATNLIAFGASEAPAKASCQSVVARTLDQTQIPIARVVVLQAVLVSVLCLVAPPITLWATAAGWLRGQCRPLVAPWMTATLAASALLCTFLSAPHGLFQLAAGYVAVTSGLMLIGALYTVHGDFFPSAIQVQP